jgi:hypothetical protein
MKRFFQRQTLRSAVTEIISIVIGVLLALAVNDWNEDRINQQMADKAIINIIEELKTNIKLINMIHASNANIIMLLNNPEKSTTNEKQRFTPGLQIQDTAWQTLITTGVSAHLEYETLYLVSNIYSIQDIYKSFGSQFINSMMSTQVLVKTINPDISDSNINLLFLGNMTLVVEIEKALLSQYEAGLLKLQQITTRK